MTCFKRDEAHQWRATKVGGGGGGENIRFRLKLDRPRPHSHIFSDL